MWNAFKKAGRRLSGFLREPLRALWRNLPPRDARHRLQNLEDPVRRAEFLRSPDYRYFAEREMRHWSDYQGVVDTSGPAAPEAPEARPEYVYFAQHPLILRELQRRALPGAADYWDWIATHYAGGEQGLVLGAGNGNHCRMLVDLGVAKRVTAIDLAEGSVNRANEGFRRLGYPIEYRVGDLNFLDLENEAYDLCLAMHVLHHVIELERLIGGLARALGGRGGALIGEEYVGPRYVEHGSAAKRLLQGLFERIPERLRLARDGRPIRRLALRDRWEVQAGSPFEAIRSDRILEIINEYFEIETQNAMGCGVLMPVLEPIIQNFDPGDDEANGVLRDLMAADWELTRRGEIPNFFLFLTARPRRG